MTQDEQVWTGKLEKYLSFRSQLRLGETSLDFHSVRALLCEQRDCFWETFGRMKET
jgi:hypothetical protein